MFEATLLVFAAMVAHAQASAMPNPAQSAAMGPASGNTVLPGISFSLPPGRAGGPSEASPATVSAAFQQFMTLAQAGQCPKALALLGTPEFPELFDQLRDSAKLAVDWQALDCAKKTRQLSLALHYAKAGTALSDPPAYFWTNRFALEWKLGDHENAVATVEEMATNAPEALRKVPVELFYEANSDLSRADEVALRQRLVRVLGRPSFAPDAIGKSVDSFREEYAALQMAAGKKASAAAALAQIEQPFVLMLASLDPRLRAAMPLAFDARTVVEKAIAHRQAIVAAHPESLAAAFYLASAYNNIDDGQSMLATLQPYRADKNQYAMTTELEAAEWFGDEAQAYVLLGRYDDAVATWREGIRSNQILARNPSGFFNLTALQLRFGHITDALTTLASLDQLPAPLNPYQKMVRHTQQGCANFLASHSAAAQADLAYLREHNDDDPEAITKLQLCMHDDAAAAVAIIRNLAIADKTATTLLQLSNFTLPPASYPADWYHEGLVRMKARTDVQAAIARAGGVGQFNIPP